jgi:hypothetical protein
MIITPAIDDEGDKKIGDELGSQEGATPGAVVDVVVNGSSGTVATVTEVGRGTLGGNVPITVCRAIDNDNVVLGLGVENEEG